MLLKQSTLIFTPSTNKNIHIVKLKLQSGKKNHQKIGDKIFSPEHPQALRL